MFPEKVVISIFNCLNFRKNTEDDGGAKSCKLHSLLAAVVLLLSIMFFGCS